MSSQQSQGSLVLSSPSQLAWCPLRGKKGKIRLIGNVTLVGRVGDESFDGLWVAPSWKIIHGKLKYRKVINTVALCPNRSTLRKTGQD